MDTAPKKKRWWDYLPFKTAIGGMAKEAGVWGWLLWVISLGGASLITGAGWLFSSLPIWALCLIFLAALALIAIIFERFAAAALKRKQSRTIDKLVSIDRAALATQLEVVSQKIAALVGEYRGPMQEAWWRDAAQRDPSAMREGMARVEGKLIEKYSDRHGAEVWLLVRRASKVIPMDRGELWRIQHGVRSEHDLLALYMFLAQLADDIRYPVAPLPHTDRGREEALKHQEEARLQAAAKAKAALPPGATPTDPNT